MNNGPMRVTWILPWPWGRNEKVTPRDQMKKLTQ
jgi:hypothetical protein